LRNPRLRAAFGIGFCILFAFIGTFTYVNFVLVRPPLSLGLMQLGFVYFVFLPSVVTTLLAGRAVQRWGTRPILWGSLALAGVGLPLLLLPNLTLVLLGMVLIGVGTFFAQATATGFVSQAATADRGAASGIYLASYFGGGLVGTAALGQVFDRIGWPACVAGIALALGVAALFTLRLRLPIPPRAWSRTRVRALGPVMRSLLSTLICAVVLLVASAAQARDLVVYGEPTLERALRSIGTLWQARTGTRVNVFVAPGNLSFAQIDRGARCDVIFALAGAVTAAAARHKIIHADTVRPAFRNSLTLVGTEANAVAPGEAVAADLAKLMAGKRVA